MFFKNMTKMITRNVGKVKLWANVHSPELLMGAGGLAIVTATIMIAKSSTKIEAIVDDVKDNLDDIDQHKEQWGKDIVRRETAALYFDTGKQLAKLYIPGITLEVLGFACVFGAHNIMKKRNVALIAAYKAVEESFTAYRNRVIAERGQDEDFHYLYGTKDVAVNDEIKAKDEKGEEKSIYSTEVKRIDDSAISPYAKFFDESNIHWQKCPEYNIFFLKRQQDYANDLLNIRGHVFLNEVYDMLGFDHTQAGAVVGWTIDGGDGYISFGIFSDGNEYFVNTQERSVLLDFNVDGIIIDKI